MFRLHVYLYRAIGIVGLSPREACMKLRWCESAGSVSDLGRNRRSGRDRRARPDLSVNEVAQKSRRFISDSMLTMSKHCVAFVNLIHKVDDAAISDGHAELSMYAEERASILKSMASVLEAMKVTGEYDPDELAPTEEELVAYSDPELSAPKGLILEED